MTNQDTFLAWCRERHIRPRAQKGSGTIWIMPRKVIQITYLGLRIDPPEITVYFNEKGRWIGGTNWLWDDRLPWIKAPSAPGEGS